MTRLTTACILVPFCSLVWATPDLNEAANGVCECLEEPYAQAQQVIDMVGAAQSSGDMSALMAAQGEMMGVISASNRCFEALAAKYPDINQSEALQQQVMAIADEQCPNPAQAFSFSQ